MFSQQEGKTSRAGFQLRWILGIHPSDFSWVEQCFTGKGDVRHEGFLGGLWELSQGQLVPAAWDRGFLGNSTCQAAAFCGEMLCNRPWDDVNAADFFTIPPSPPPKKMMQTPLLHMKWGKLLLFFIFLPQKWGKYFSLPSFPLKNGANSSSS